MISETHLAAFVDELEKIAAQKSRKKSVPIRAHNLAAKSRYDGRGKTSTKLAAFPGMTAAATRWLRQSALPAAKGFAGKHPLIAGTAALATPVVAWEDLKGRHQAYQIGRAMQERMAQQQAG